MEGAEILAWFGNEIMKCCNVGSSIPNRLAWHKCHSNEWTQFNTSIIEEYPTRHMPSSEYQWIIDCKSLSFKETI